MEDEFLEYASKKKDLFWSIFFFFFKSVLTGVVHTCNLSILEGWKARGLPKMQANLSFVCSVFQACEGQQEPDSEIKQTET